VSLPFYPFSGIWSWEWVRLGVGGLADAWVVGEDFRFREYLEMHGWDTRQMGSKEYQMRSSSSVNTELDKGRY